MAFRKGDGDRSVKRLPFRNNRYRTAGKSVNFLARYFPSFWFYCRFVAIVFRSSFKAKRKNYDDEQWCNSSYEVLKALESCGVNVEIGGIDNIKQLNSPCVIIGNHMSFLETVLLPVIIVPFRKITYIIKESPLTYPVFKHVMRSRNPIAVTRTNPRQDLKTVMSQGVDRLQEGISVIVFPQTTRSHEFDPKQLSTIGVKLARKAGVPVVPLAVKTDALRNGKYHKDFGKLDPSRKVFFSFGRPLEIKGRGDEEHQAILSFIGSQLLQWQENDELQEDV